MSLEDDIRAIARAEVERALAARPAETRAPAVELITDVEVAKILNVAHETVRGWRRTGDGPPWIKIGGHAVRYERAALAAWIEAGK